MPAIGCLDATFCGGYRLAPQPSRQWWYCFEVNTSPAFTYYEGRAGLPIGAAIARLLAAGAADPRRTTKRRPASAVTIPAIEKSLQPRLG
jgi:hypothetical protein